MKNVRTSSLDPSRPTAAKDCRLCNRRRISCDRTLPACRKCTVRKLDCPGYGLRFRWENGVASRGKLVGQRFGAEHDRGACGEFRDDLKHSNAIATIMLERVSGPGPTHLMSSLPFDLRQEAIALFRYYEDVVAALMPWTDGPNNQWRVALIPLAMQCPSLFYAILALSAEHQSKRKSAHAEGKQPSVAYFRDCSLTLLATELRQEVQGNGGGNQSSSRHGVLASILVLCQLELIRTDASLWHIHWDAVRIIVTSWAATSQGSIIMDDTSRFLVKEAFVFDVFASTTRFDCETYVPDSLMQDNNTDVFVDYLRLVRQVTQAERARHIGPDSSQSQRVLRDVESVREAFESTRQRNLELRKHMHFKSQDHIEDFDTLIDIFHHAGMVYALQALDLAAESAAAQNVDCSTIMDKINRIRDWGAFHHDLVWPIFIVGTQARQFAAYQQPTETRMQQAMESTGFGNCYPALRFLQRFWATNLADVPDWMAYARQESQRGVQFLVI